MTKLEEILGAIGEVGKKVDDLGARVTALEEVATEPEEAKEEIKEEIKEEAKEEIKEDIKEEVKEDVKEEVMLEEAECGDKKEEIKKSSEDIKKSSDDIAKLQQRILMLEQKGAKLMQVEQPKIRLTKGAEFINSNAFKNFEKSNFKGHVSYEFTKGTPLTNNLETPYSVGTVGGVSDQGFVEDPKTILNIENLFAHAPIADNTFLYMPLTVTGNAGFIAEGSAKPETTFKVDAKTGQVKTIATWTKVSEQLFADKSQLINILDNNLTHAVDVTVQNQLISGDGLGENLSGISKVGNFTDYVTGAGTATNTVDLLRNVAFKMRGANIDNLTIVLNWTDWSALLGLKSTSNEYLINGILDPVKQTIYGIPVVLSSAMTAGKFAMGNFKMGGIVFDKTSMALEIDRTGDDFTKNLITIRAERRLGFAVVQPKAICYGDLTVGG